MKPTRPLLKRVRTKLMISFIIVAVIPLLIVGVFSGQAAERLLMLSAQDAQMQQVDKIKRTLTSNISQGNSAVVYLANSSAMKNVLSLTDASEKQNRQLAITALQHDMITLATVNNNIYSHIRYINEYGLEKIRVELNNGKYSIAPDARLQNQSNSKYFQQGRNLNAGSVYISELNPHNENMSIESAQRPVLRYVTPVFYTSGASAGIVVINLNITPFFNKLGSNYLVNHNGDYLYQPESNLRWGASGDLDNDRSFKSQYPNEWDTINSKTRGIIERGNIENFTSYSQLKISDNSETWFLVRRDNQIETLAQITRFQNILNGGLGISLLVTIIFAGLIGGTVTKPLNQLTSIVKRVADGDEQARANITSQDEFADLGEAFDKMVEERISTLHRAEKENEALNNSIVELMEATNKLSENDLSIIIPVREDVTGVVADGLNKMVRETAKILNVIKTVAQEVQQAAESVKTQSNRVTKVADDERSAVENTLSNLNRSTKTMTEIADVAQSCNDLAERAFISTEKALATVNNTVAGMNDIRVTISETEKRIKRLGERSQEITSVVEIINNISERTHVLALNASMQAAAAGEAGRGFAVVADEVQRLAENSRDSTSQIAALVHSIQTETSETMATMNKSITQVVSGSQLAEESGQQMQETKIKTRELVEVVQTIAQRSAEQAQSSEALREYAAGIQESTQITGRELSEQSKHTDNLVKFAQRMKDAVDIFKLPRAS